MNKFRFTVNNGDTYINLPVEINFDNLGYAIDANTKMSIFTYSVVNG